LRFVTEGHAIRCSDSAFNGGCGIEQVLATEIGWRVSVEVFVPLSLVLGVSYLLNRRL